MIGAGHRLSDIRDYTLPQIKLFCTEVGKQEAQHLRQMAMAARSANAKQQDFDKMMRALDGQAD